MKPGVSRDFIPTLFCQHAKHLVYLSAIPLSFNSMFRSYSCLYSKIFTLNSLIYSLHNLQFSFLGLDLLGLSTPRDRSRRCCGQSPQPKVLQPHFTVEIQQSTAFTSRACSTPPYSLRGDSHLLCRSALHICHWLGSWLLQEQVFCRLQLS